ncbi:retrovirus-related pol polyprotein from transposon TNT 1-94 [Tanacetum coccineum]|uniref:Retrovirus-related pol polyprotein from transposon TNT 1-94 n=1 Tax=Tanacetum coccineum TaxID=301880 RepID=A0ABQ4YTQ8_9ASTR
MIPELGDAARAVHVPETFHEQTDDELTEAEIKQMEADDQAIQTILPGLPEDIYAAVDSCETAQEIWFTSTDGESIESYYHCFSKLMNDFKRNKHFPEKIASNLKFLNNLQPEWSRHNQKEVDDLRAERLAKTQDPLALMANSNNPFNYPVFHPDLPSSIPNPGVQNVGNQNGLIVVPGIANQNRNGNVVAAQAEGNAIGNNGNQIRCYNYRGLGHLARNCIVRQRRRDATYLQTQLLIAQKEEAGIQLQAEEFDLMAAAADLDKIEEVNANCILMANLQQASTSGTQSDNAPVYDSDGSAEVQLHDNCYNDEIFNMFTQEEQYTELLEPIPEPHQVPHNDSNVISEVSSVEQEADESLAKHKALVYEIERLLKAVVSQDIMSIVQCNSVVDTSNLQTELDRTKEKLETSIIKKEKEYGITQIFDKVCEQTDTSKGTSGNTKLAKQTIMGNQPSRSGTKLYSVTPFLNSKVIPKVGETNALSKPVTSNSAPSTRESNVVNNDRVIALGMFRINPFTTYREKKYVPNKPVKASVRTKPITVSQSSVIHKQNVNSNSNGLSSTGVDNIAKTRGHSLGAIQRMIGSSKFVYGALTRVLFLAYTGNLKLSHSILSGSLWETVRFGNHHVCCNSWLWSRQWGNIIDCKVVVSMVEGLGHNLFSVEQFCDSDLEVAFRRNTCLVRNLEGVDMLKGNRTTNLYTINLHEMTSSSLIFLIACATSTKSWTIPLSPRMSKGKSKKGTHPPKRSKFKADDYTSHMDLCSPMKSKVSMESGKMFPGESGLITPLILVLLQARVIIVRTDNSTEFKNQGLEAIATRATLKPLHPFTDNGHEDIGKLGAKGDIGFFIGYSVGFYAYRVYNRRTKKIMETMNVTFDELSAMTFEQRKSKPRLQAKTSRTITMYDDLTLSGQPSAAPRTTSTAQAPQVLQTPTTSTTIDTAPTPTISSSQAANIPNTSQDVDELEPQQKYVHQRDNQAQLQSEIVADNVQNATFDANTFVNSFAPASTSAAESPNVKEVMTDPSSINSMQEELLQFKRLDVRVLVTASDNIKPLTLKWLFKNKHDEENTVIRNKTRLVVRGYRQEEGIDFKECFVPDDIK